jgi:hypothetical protein
MNETMSRDTASGMRSRSKPQTCRASIIASAGYSTKNNLRTAPKKFWASVLVKSAEASVKRQDLTLVLSLLI